MVSAEKNGDQRVDFYWIDPVLSELLESQNLPGNLTFSLSLKNHGSGLIFVQNRAFGRVNGGLLFESAHLIGRGSVPLLSVFLLINRI